MKCFEAKEVLSNVSYKSSGYGCLKVDGQEIRAHRHVWEQCFGPIPAGMCVLHDCDNPPCVNPDHLFLGTHADNMRDMREKGRVRHGSKHCRAKLTPEDVREIRASKELSSVLAKRFGITPQGIHSVRIRNSWGHLA